MAVSIQVTFDCADPDRLAHFWAELLGYQLDPPPPGYAYGVPTGYPVVVVAPPPPVAPGGQRLAEFGDRLRARPSGHAVGPDQA